MAVKLSVRDQEILQAVMLSLNSPPDIDFDRLATNGGFKNAGSARACFNGIKKKLGQIRATESGGGTKEARAPAMGRKRKDSSTDASVGVVKKGKKVKEAEAALPAISEDDTAAEDEKTTVVKVENPDE